MAGVTIPITLEAEIKEIRKSQLAEGDPSAPFLPFGAPGRKGGSAPCVNDSTALSESLRKYRLQANLSQTELAAKLEVTLSAVARWE